MTERSPLALLRGALVAATAASIGYQVTAMLAARRWRGCAPRREDQEGAPPPVSILKPIRGLEPHAQASFASYCAQEYPEYELLFGVAEASDPAAALILRLAGRYANPRVRLVETRAELGPNRKVCNLHGLAAAARYDLLLVSDSDMRVQPDYLRRVLAPFHDPRVGLVTCPYRGAEPEGLPAALEALGIAASFMPGVFVAALGASPFAFGSTVALRRETLERIGGFAGLVEYLADDFQMGRRVADLGLQVHLSSVVVDSVLGRRPFRETWSRRLRWARTVRACRPLGHLGSGLTHTTALALLTALCALRRSERKRESARWDNHRATEAAEELAPAPESWGRGDTGERTSAGVPPPPAFGGGGQGVGAGLLIAAALLVRGIAAWRVSVVELKCEAARRWFWLLPVSDLLEAALWASSLFGRTVLWRGQRYRLREGGRIERV